MCHQLPLSISSESWSLVPSYSERNGCTCILVSYKQLSVGVDLKSFNTKCLFRAGSEG